MSPCEQSQKAQPDQLRRGIAEGNRRQPAPHNPLLSSTCALKCTREVAVAQMTPEVSRLLEQALSLSVEEQEALVDSLITSLGEKVEEGVLGAWDEEIKRRISELDSGNAKTVPWTEVRQRNLGKLSRAR